ncbi:MAG: hypothetical protein ABIS59_04160 [Candidatus Saccharibacteria bacterium]
MRLSFARVGMAIATASVSLLPFAAAHAQFSGTNGQIYFNYIQGANSVVNIAAANLDGTESHIVIPSVASKNLVDFQVSPDGTKLAYVLDDFTGSTDVYSLHLANADGTSDQIVYSAPTGSPYSTIRSIGFKSDGTTIFFYQGNSISATDGIYSVAAVAASTPTELIPDTYGSGTQTNRNNFVVGSSKLFIDKAVFASSVTTNTITSANLDGTGEATLYTPADPTKSFKTQDISPDGLKLAFIAGDGNNIAQLYTINAADGTGLTALTSSISDNVRGAYYSPDNAKIVDFSNAPSGTDTIQVGAKIMNADGTGSPTAFRTNAEAPMWSTVAAAAPGTFPSVLGDAAQGQSAQQGGGTPAALPDAGHTSSKAPIALAIIATLAVIGIEAGRRVRIRR